MPSPLIVVIGSINMDLVVRVPALPARGQTVAGSGLALHPGGKGANQAVAAARLGAVTHLVARVGSDEFGNRLLSNLEAQKVASTFVTVTEGVPTGTASITVEESTGENAIVLSAGANARLSPADVDRAAALIRTAGAVIVQLEVPAETVLHAIALCHRSRVPVILDPAPVPPAGLPPEMLSVSILTPNEGEARLLAGLAPAEVARPVDIARALLARGPAAVALKLGPGGSVFIEASGEVHIAPAYKVKVKDTTAAGDAFTAALAVARSEGAAGFDALRFANAAGALACTLPGAQPSLPRRPDVDDVLRRWSREPD